MSANRSSAREAVEGWADAPRSKSAGPTEAAWDGWQSDRLAALQRELAKPSLSNRKAIIDALGAAIREATASGNPAAAMLLDLNGFLGINAAWGPAMGDQVLAATGDRISHFLAHAPRGGGTAYVGHLDSDHYLVVLTDVENFGALRALATELIAALAQPIVISEQSLSVSARAAIVQVPKHGRSVTSVLARGFRLLNTAARSTSDSVAISESDSGTASSLIMLERDLNAALSTDQLFVALQPKVEATTGLIHGAEALARWNHPERGALPPLVFVEAAEQSGLIFDLGLRILRDVCRASNGLAKSGKPFNLAVNVSPHQLAHNEFLGRFLEVVDREGVNPETLEIEVTETAAMMGGERMLESLRALRRCGIGVAIDDFGTGFSNLASLSALPADGLKIDRSLVSGSDDGGKAEALLGLAVNLGQTFGLITVAEGVETGDQLQRLKALGCDLIQGYYTGRPVPSSEFAERYLRD